jgi:lipid A 3-O-deacylase
MKQFLLIAAFTMLYGEGCLLNAQALHTDHPISDTTERLLRIYEDDDFINIRGRGTDNAYTNGTRLDYFYTPGHRPRGFIANIIPRAGDSSVAVYGWGLMQLMYTPDDISSTAYQPDDYPYSGALIAIHSLYSYNPVKKYDFQTELVAGILGPAALDQQTQTLVHHLIHYIRPMGWSHQFQNAPLLNVNFTAEKQLAAVGQTVEIIGGGQVYAGTMMNGLALYPLIRIGMMNPYFRGFFSQFISSGRNERRKKRWQAYFVLKPEGQLIFTEAVLQGGLFTTNPNLKQDGSGDKQGSPAPLPYHAIQKVVGSVNYGAVVSSGDFSISFNQNTSSAMMKGLYSHEVGNISLYFGW